MAFSSAPYDDTIDAAARANGLDPNYLRGVLKRESGFDPNAVNRASGAQGLGQVLPSTAARPGYGVPPLTDPFDPVRNINFSASYLAARQRVAGGDLNQGTIGYSGNEYGSGGITPIGRADGQIPGSTGTAVPIANNQSSDQAPAGQSPIFGGGGAYQDPQTGATASRDGSTTGGPTGTNQAPYDQRTGSLHDWFRRGAIGLLGLIMVGIALVAFVREGK